MGRIRDKRDGWIVRSLRQGVALGLALVAVWAISLITDVSALGNGVSSLAGKSSVAVSLMSGQVGWKPEPPTTPLVQGWGRLLLRQSALLSAGEELLASGGYTAQTPDDLPDTEEGDEGGEHQQAPDLAAPGQDTETIETTAKGQPGKHLYGQGVYFYNRTNFALDASVLSEGKVDVTLGEGPQILILHTHGSEAYTPSDGNTYQESDPYRTTDCTRNVVKVGAEMATVFRAHGFQVIHDTNLYDYPSYNGAYDRSRLAVEQWLAQYPTIKIVLDVHRDALVDNDGRVYKLITEEAGEKVAQIMLVVGSSGAGLEHPYWKNNLAFATLLQQSLIKGYLNLARPIVLRNSRYNQQLTPGSLLVEVGGHGNTLTEAIAGARLWTDNVARSLLKLSEQGK